ncbi:MAG: hypothetical protein ACP5TH_03955 [Fervidicoccaceae archaeon]
MKRLYIASSIFVLILFYIVPYLFFRNVKDIKLLLFWTLSAILWIAVSLLTVWRLRME